MIRPLRTAAPVLAGAALAWAAPARAAVVVTVIAGNPGGAGGGTPNLDPSGLTQLDTFLYYGPQFGVRSRRCCWPGPGLLGLTAHRRRRAARVAA